MWKLVPPKKRGLFLNKMTRRGSGVTKKLLTWIKNLQSGVTLHPINDMHSESPMDLLDVSQCPIPESMYWLEEEDGSVRSVSAQSTPRSYTPFAAAFIGSTREQRLQLLVVLLLPLMTEGMMTSHSPAAAASVVTASFFSFVYYSSMGSAGLAFVRSVPAIVETVTDEGLEIVSEVTDEGNAPGI